MLSRFENSAAAMNALQRNQEQIANNLANANTTGHKRSRVVSEDLLYQLLYQNVQANGEGEASGGEPAELNMAINGDGFFQVRRPGGNLA